MSSGSSIRPHALQWSTWLLLSGSEILEVRHISLLSVCERTYGHRTPSDVMTAVVDASVYARNRPIRDSSAPAETADASLTPRRSLVRTQYRPPPPTDRLSPPASKPRLGSPANGLSMGFGDSRDLPGRRRAPPPAVARGQLLTRRVHRVGGGEPRRRASGSGEHKTGFSRRPCPPHDAKMGLGVIRSTSIGISANRSQDRLVASSTTLRSTTILFWK
jgi:hypothetical protein